MDRVETSKSREIIHRKSNIGKTMGMALKTELKLGV
jgi:hypothetical protein